MFINIDPTIKPRVFSKEKYQALAFGSPQGTLLQQLVEEHWSEWVETVTVASWLKHWKRSSLYLDDKVEGTSRIEGIRGIEEVEQGQTRIASSLFVEAVWGFGVADWLNTAPGNTNKSFKTICLLRGIKAPNMLRTDIWDSAIAQGCGLFIPTEFGALDAWLEPLWLQALLECGGQGPRAGERETRAEQSRVVQNKV